MHAGGASAGAEILDADFVQAVHRGFLQFEPERVQTGAAERGRLWPAVAATQKAKFWILVWSVTGAFSDEIRFSLA